jgi:hypothetical protein
MLPIPEHIWSRLKLRLDERKAGSVTLWLDDEGRIISADFDREPADEARDRALLRRCILEVLAEADTGKRRRLATH